MRPLFFGDSQRQLFGVFHASDSGSPLRDTRVVLAYPWMAEYNMSHLAFRKLAALLAREGFPTLRFDYFGTGDSSGEAADARCRDWVADIKLACNELGAMSDARALAVVGFGLGAALATKVAEEITLDTLVLWEPVVTGEEFLAKLDRLDAAQRLHRLYPRQPDRVEERTQLLGYPLSADARADLAALNVLHMHPRVEGDVTIIAGSERPRYSELLRLFNKARLELVEDDSGAAPAGGETAMLSSAPLQAIVRAVVQAEVN
jgi:pimeloyl-ACP methyl ester carboxylesterase